MTIPRRESEYTKPHADCPNPDLWTAEDAYSAEVEVAELVGAFVRAVQPDYVIETGTCWGYTAEHIGKALRANGHGRLDTLEVDGIKVTRSEMRCRALPVSVIHCASLQFEPPEPIGFAWIDSKLDLRIAEFEHFRPWFRPGTILGFHDTAPTFGNYGGQVDNLPGCRSIRLRTPRGVTFTEVIWT